MITIPTTSPLPSITSPHIKCQMTTPAAFVIPGLGTAIAQTDSSPLGPPEAAPIDRKTLAPNTEYRFEVPFSRAVFIKLLTGTAELFGSELAPGRRYEFRGVKAAVFTYHGCRLEVEGQPEGDYVGEETEMTMAYNAHFALEEMRQADAAVGGIGPRVLMLGPENTGKTTLARILANYALKTGSQPTLVNLNPAEGLLSLPGSFSAVTMSGLMDVQEVGGWGSSPISGPRAIPVKMPLVHHYGCRTAEENKASYKALVTRLALAVTSRLDRDHDSKSAGCFIDTSGSISSSKAGSYHLIQHIVSEFSVNVILVLGSERLYKDMTRLFAATPTADDEPIAVVKFARSEGCFDRDETYMRQLRRAQTRNYFFGSALSPLSPYTLLVDFDQLNIFKIIEHGRFSSTFNPGYTGDYDTGSALIYEKVAPSNLLQNLLLAITFAAASDGHDVIRDSGIMGYMYIAEVDEMKQKVRLLTPVSGKVPSNALVVGEWPEGVVDIIS